MSAPLRACLKSYLPGNRVFSSKLGFFRNPQGRPLFNGILSPYSANRVRSIVGAWFPSPMGWEPQPLPCDTARCGLTNPQHRGIIPCFLKQVLRNLEPKTLFSHRQTQNVDFGKSTYSKTITSVAINVGAGLVPTQLGSICRMPTEYR